MFLNTVLLWLVPMLEFTKRVNLLVRVCFLLLLPSKQLYHLIALLSMQLAACYLLPFVRKFNSGYEPQHFLYDFDKINAFQN